MAKKSCFFDSSIPAAAASWRGELEQNTILVEAARVGLMIDSGPMSQPTRQPVAAKDSVRNRDMNGLGGKNKVELTPCRANGDGPLPHVRESRDPDMVLIVVYQTVVLEAALDLG